MCTSRTCARAGDGEARRRVTDDGGDIGTQRPGQHLATHYFEQIMARWGARRSIFLLLCEQSGVRLFVVLGNHEDYDRVASMRADDDGWLFLKDYPRLRFAPRGHTWVDDSGTRIAALGGAGSIDRNLRRPGLSWWPGEELTDDDCARLVHNVREQGWPRVDVMLTRDAPAGLRRLGMPSRPAWHPRGRGLLRRPARAGVMPAQPSRNVVLAPSGSITGARCSAWLWTGSWPTP
jgi:hypothetical protein